MFFNFIKQIEHMSILNLLLFMPQGNSESSGFMSFLPIFLIILVFYLFFIRPQIKKSKTQRLYRESLKKGDKIITIGGIHGKITDVKETSFTVEIANNTIITIEKSAVAGEGGAQLGQNK